MRIRIPKILKHSKSPPSPAGNYLVGRGRLFYFNSKEESAWHTGKSTFASTPTATTPAGQAMPTEPHSKRKAAACSKSWGGQLPWLVSAKTSYGEGIRTATNKERGISRQPTAQVDGPRRNPKPLAAMNSTTLTPARRRPRTPPKSLWICPA